MHARRRDPTERLAARFAAKEAVMKAMGVGLGSSTSATSRWCAAARGPRRPARRQGRALAAERGITRGGLADPHRPHRAGGRDRVLTRFRRDHHGGAQRRHRPAWHHRRQMIPVVTPEEMAAIDAAAPEPVEVLIGRAGAAVARAGDPHARRHLRAHGRRGRRQGQQRQRRARRGRGGCASAVCGSSRSTRTTSPDTLPPRDLVIDAAYGTGFRGSWRAPATRRPRSSPSTSRPVSTG